MFSDSGARAVAARGRSRSSWPAISGVKSISAPRAFAVWIACTIACALRSGSIPLVFWKIAVRINGSGLEEQIQLALTFQRSEEHTSELKSLIRNSYAVFCMIKKQTIKENKE